MPTIQIPYPEQFDSLFRKFKRLCERAGIISMLRQKEFYEKPTWVRKRKNAAAKKRNFRRQNMTV